MTLPTFIRTVVLAAAVASGTTYAGPCATDIDGNGSTGFSDLLVVLGNWGACPTPPAECPADATEDGIVGFADLLATLSGWGPCGFAYPEYENDFAAELAVDMLGPDGPLTAPQEMYDRWASDIETIWAMRPETALTAHYGAWVPREILVGVDTDLPLDGYHEKLAFYGAEIVESYFGGSIQLVRFPRPVNIPAMAIEFDTLVEIEYAEPNNSLQLPANPPGFHATIIGPDALEWQVNVWWYQGGVCDFDNEPCECYTTYQYVSPPGGPVTEIDVQTFQSPIFPGSDCSIYPPR